MNDPQYKVTGALANEVYGHLYYYTRRSTYDNDIMPDGYVGLPVDVNNQDVGGVYLTPSLYAADIAPYNLGLNRPVDLCLAIRLPDGWELWGPATSECHPNCQWQDLWEGGAIEFFSPNRVPIQYVVDEVDLEPRGDRHRLKGLLA
jgi:hypothetical protein